jgi:hypothetical protein
MACDHDHLEYETVPIRVADDGFTPRDEESGIPTTLAMRWSDLEGFHDHVTRRLLDQ